MKSPMLESSPSRQLGRMRTVATRRPERSDVDPMGPTSLAASRMARKLALPTRAAGHVRRTSAGLALARRPRVEPARAARLGLGRVDHGDVGALGDQLLA